MKHDGLLMLPYSTDENGKVIWKRVSNLIKEDPEFLMDQLGKKSGLQVNEAIMIQLKIALKKKSSK